MQFKKNYINHVNLYYCHYTNEVSDTTRLGQLSGLIQKLTAKLKSTLWS